MCIVNAHKVYVNYKRNVNEKLGVDLRYRQQQIVHKTV
jgi:hypothetical protein